MSAACSHSSQLNPFDDEQDILEDAALTMRTLAETDTPRSEAKSDPASCADNHTAGILQGSHSSSTDKGTIATRSDFERRVRDLLLASKTNNGSDGFRSDNASSASHDHQMDSRLSAPLKLVNGDLLIDPKGPSVSDTTEHDPYCAEELTAKDTPNDAMRSARMTAAQASLHGLIPPIVQANMRLSAEREMAHRSPEEGVSL